MLQKRDKGYAKVIHKKREKKKKVEKKNGHKSVCDIENNGYLDACLKKEMNKIAHILSQKMFSCFKREISFQGAK